MPRSWVTADAESEMNTFTPAALATLAKRLPCTVSWPVLVGSLHVHQVLTSGGAQCCVKRTCSRTHSRLADRLCFRACHLVNQRVLVDIKSLCVCCAV
jgi:hypothetical protein